MEVKVAQAPVKAPKKKHPSQRYWAIATLILFFAFLCALISIFVPWSRVDPISTTTGTNTFWVGLWKNCLSQNDIGDTFTCANIDIDATTGPTGNNSKCKDYFVATQVLTIITTCMAFLGLVILVLLTGKLWTPKAMVLAGISFGWWLMTLGCAIAAWACWLVYGEENCNGTTSTSIPSWPIQGYSYGFILMCTCSGLILIGLLAICAGLLSLKKPVYVAKPVATPVYQEVPQPVYTAPYTAAPAYPAMAGYGYPTVY